MTTLRTTLVDFSDVLGSLLGKAPDNYPDWSYNSYERDKAEVQELWLVIRTKLKHDTDKIELIDTKLKEALDAFDAGDRDKGQWAIAAIYNLPVTKLR